MNSRKNSLLPHRPENLAAVRQLLRNKLLEAGLDVEVGKKGKVKEKEKKVNKIQHRQFDIENIRGPQSFRSNKLLMSEFRNVFSQNYKQVLSHREDERRFSRECVQGLRYNYSFQRSKECSPYSLKDVIFKIKEKRQPQKQTFVLPEVRVRRRIRSQKTESYNIINIKRLLEHSVASKKQRREEKPRRSKTEQKDHFQPKKLLKQTFKGTLYKQVAPWEVQFYRDTRVVFN